MTEREDAIARYVATGAKWPPKMAKVAPWRDTHRWQSLPCRSCGGPCDPDRRWCEHCSAVLP